MSTYYKFRCPKCGEAGGFFSCQAWGWGNCDIFSNFKFIVAHSHCGTIEILSEHAEAYFDDSEELRWLERLESDEDLRKNVWPHANEWAHVKESWEGSHVKWHEGLDRKLAWERERAAAILSAREAE